MRRREFIWLLGGSAVAWPLAARAQQLTIPVIGILHFGTAGSYDLSGLHQGLKEAGLNEGHNLVIEYRWANSDVNRLPELAVDLVRRRVAVIVPLASALAARAAKEATATIPIVFGYGGDPVREGLVDSINRPGRNVTGISSMSGELGSKRLGLLRELLPGATQFALLVRPGNPSDQAIAAQTQTAAAGVGAQCTVYGVNNGPDIDNAFVQLVQDRMQALLVGTDILFADHRMRVVGLAAQYAVPTIYAFRDGPQAGGLISYGPNLPDRDRQVGLYVGRILGGEKPAELPVQAPTRFELVINLKTVRMLDLTVPPGVLAIADEVIE